MRCAPYALAYRNAPAELVDVSRQPSAITHADPRCQWSYALFNQTLANLLIDVERPLKTGDMMLDELQNPLEDSNQAASIMLGAE